MTLVQKKIFVLSGAGISKESGIKTFRESDGLWENYKVEDVCTPQAFLKNPELVNKFYNDRKKQMNNPKIKPNNAHIFLSKLEKKFLNGFMLVTQNIDNLHEKAGSKKVYHMHGSLEKKFCMSCSYTSKFNKDISTEQICKKCNQKGKTRVDVVWFGEMPKYLDEIYNFLEKVDVFISVGTSNLVYPAAGFIDYVKLRNNKAKLIEFNLEKTPKSALFDRVYIGKASTTIPKFVNSFK